MRNIYILISKNNKYIGQTKRMVDASKHAFLVMDEMLLNQLNDDDIIYPLIANFDTFYDIKRFSNFINKAFYLKTYHKKEIQNVLKENGISVPTMLTNVVTYPVFIKENKHEGITKKVHNKKALLELSSTLNDYYIEEFINGIKEEKYYYIFGDVFDKSKKIEDDVVISICNQVSKTLSLDVMSLDILFTDSMYYVVDVNPSPGFYNSSIAREEFVKRLKKYKVKKMNNIR